MSPEAYVGEILVRVGLSVTALAIAITAVVIAVRTRTTEYPAKLANKLAELEADVVGFEIKLAAVVSDIQSIRGKMAAHQRHNTDRAAAAAGAEAPAPADAPLTVSRAIWDRMSPTQRQGLTEQGYTAAG